MSDPNTSATGAEMSTAETLTGIFFEPSRTFEALRARPRFLVGGIILLVIACLVTVLLYTRVDMGQYIRDRIERSPQAAQLSDAQKDMQVRMGKNLGMLAIPVSVPIIIAGGAALYLLGVLAFGGSLSYKKSLAVWVYSSIPPSVLGALIAILVLFLKSPDSIDPEHMVATNPAVLLGEDASKILVAVLSQFDLLRFYGMFLAALGLRKVGKLSSTQAWGVVIALWAIGALLRIGSAAIFGR
ncbi:MAG TPA: Yip1 family protein [Pyrinomonadaceae bacterium]|jgi:Yip1-like protein|nr:Yip1 family protein [Pyrinomonadaceae bacterium]